MRLKEDTRMHNVELLDRRAFPRSSRNLDQKNVLRRTKNAPVASARGTIYHKSKLGFPRIRNLAKIGQKRIRARKPRKIRIRAGVEDKTATWRLYELARHHHAPRGIMPREACTPPYKTSLPPAHLGKLLLEPQGCLSVE